MKRHFFILVQSLFLTSLSANDANLASEGGNIFPMNHASVQMHREDIAIDLAKDTLRAACRFVFVNHGAKAALTMGFPASACIDKDAEIDALEIRNFSTLINNTVVKVTYKNSMRGFDSSYTMRTVMCDDAPGWYCWNTEISENDTLVVNNSYSGDLEPVSYGTVTAAYTVGTGATWHKYIASGRIVFRFGDVISSLFLVAKTDGGTVFPDSVVFTFSNLKPAWNQGFFIELISPLKFSDSNIDIKMGDIDKKTAAMQHTANEYRLMRNEIFARHGYIFKDATLAAYFRNKRWYVPDRNFTPDSLSRFEKELIAFIKTLEKKRPEK